MRRSNFSIVTGLVMLMVIVSAGVARAEDLPLSWQCLPQQTIFVVRMPQPKQLMEKLRTTTKLGKTMLSEQRIAQLWKLIEEANPEEWKKMTEDLGKAGLKPEDLPHYLEGECGMAMVGEKREGAQPLMMMLMWLNCGEELAGKLEEQMKQSVAEKAEKDPEHAPKRVDMELEGLPVTLLSEAHMETDWKSYQQEINKRFEQQDDMQGQALPVQPRQAAEKDDEGPANDWPQIKMVHADQRNTMMTRIGGRVLMAVNLPTNSATYFKQIEGGKTADQINFDELSGMQQMTGVFARFLAAHKSGGADYSTHLMSTPGLAAAMPDGVPIIEAYGDLRPVWAMLTDEDLGEAKKVFHMLGIDQMTTMGLRMALDGSVIRSGIFVAAPTPRVGLMALLDQPKQEPQPAAWAPAHLMQYQQAAFDLGKMYAQVREMAIKEFGDEAKQSFDNIDVSMQGAIQADLETVLAALGSKIYLISYEPRTAGKKFEDIHPGDLQRMAWVWQIKDEQMLQKALTQLAALGTLTLGDKLEKADEQGFTGWRMNLPQTSVGIMLGKGYLAVTMGFGVSDQLLNVLGNPPQGTGTLAASEVMGRARSVVDLQSNNAFAVTNMDMYVQAMVPLILEALFNEKKDTDDPNAKKAMEDLNQWMPSADEMKGMLGVGVFQTRMTDQGMLMQGGIEVPE